MAMTLFGSFHPLFLTTSRNIDFGLGPVDQALRFSVVVQRTSRGFAGIAQ